MSNNLKSLRLLLAKKSETSKPIVAKPSVFGDESDEEPLTASEKFEIKYSSNKSKDQRMVEKVMAEDPNAYKYDEVYDEIEKQKNVKTAEDKAKDKEKAPKYADKIILAHKKRKLEKLLVEERKFKKERASEGTEFDDKEAFVTGAYKKQIEERNKFREEIEKQDYIDSLTKVENQKMWQSGFHRILLNNLTTDEKIEIRGEEKNKFREEIEKQDYIDSLTKVENQKMWQLGFLVSRTNDELHCRLEVIKEVLKQRNTENDIKNAKERYYIRLESGEVTLPV
uniref:Nuclear speckle splicing regulatory protein 1 N-terminal domain-containing protein n=1 Tax=Acrobeloides nanus TaxID=290746 RepID=A0A914DRS2_9BILA